MMKNALDIIIIISITGFSVWLYSNDKAAEPGALSIVHEDFPECATCHIPWQRVTEQACLECHYFDDATELNPMIRFHTANGHCLECHTEHRGFRGVISEMDHTVLNGELSCTNCHYDPHKALFGNGCRACHHITTWEIKGFRHPSDENRNCHRCHRPPQSHHETVFWEKIQSGHARTTPREGRPSVQDCWRCHNTHMWGHLLMKHDL